MHDTPSPVRSSRWSRATTCTPSLVVLAVLAVLSACDGPAPAGADAGPEVPAWEVLTEEQPGALLSVWAASADDVWVVGADARDGTGPIVLRHRGGDVERVSTGLTDGDLWWVFGFAGGPVYMGGSGGVILRVQDNNIVPMATPDGRTVFGLWGTSSADMWAVGGASGGGGGFAWRLVDDAWEAEPTVPADIETTGAIWKVHGRAADDAWLVGSNGIALHWDGAALTPGDTGVGASLFTVFGTVERYVAVGGEVSEIIVEHDGDGWVNATPEERTPFLSGVFLADADTGVATGANGLIMERSATGWAKSSIDVPTSEDLHGVFIDDRGGVWVAGGHTLSFPLSDGVLLYRPPAGGEG